jgi:hypothetical protein
VIRGQASAPDEAHAIQCITAALNDLSRRDIAGAEMQTHNAMPHIWRGTMPGEWNPAGASSPA